MQNSYPVPDLQKGQLHETSVLIKRSRFITHIARAQTPDEAKAFIESMRTQYNDATHNCWAFVAGPPGSTARIGASDDGEPHGTAGRPMLNVLLHCPVGEIACVVTRYFGGIKLGTGGLVRAYQDCVSQCLESLPVTMKVALIELRLQVDYADSDRVHRLLPKHKAQIIGEDYAEHMSLLVSLPQSGQERFLDELAQASDGRVQVEQASL